MRTAAMRQQQRLSIRGFATNCPTIAKAARVWKAALVDARPNETLASRKHNHTRTSWSDYPDEVLQGRYYPWELPKHVAGKWLWKRNAPRRRDQESRMRETQPSV